MSRDEKVHAGNRLPGRDVHTWASLTRRLRLSQLAVFEKVAASGSMSAAAHELAMSQSAVSKSIRELERQIGGALFTRTGRGVTPTPLGRVFARHGHAVMADLQSLAEDLNAVQAGVTGYVAVGTMLVATSALLPEAIARLHQAAPEVMIHVQVGLNPVLFPKVKRGELDLVVGYLPFPATAAGGEAQPGLQHVPLYAEGLRVVVARDHPLARRERLEASDLVDQDWIVPTSDSVAANSVRDFFAGHQMELPRRRIESVSILTNVGLLVRRPMLALIPGSAAARLAQVGLVSVLPLRGSAPVGTVGYTLRSQAVENEACQRFITTLHEVAAELQQAGPAGTP